jgi:hypothetical protein
MTPTLRHLTFGLGLLLTAAWLACVLPPQPTDDDDNDDASADDDDTGDDDTGDDDTGDDDTGDDDTGDDDTGDDDTGDDDTGDDDTGDDDTGDDDTGDDDTGDDDTGDDDTTPIDDTIYDVQLGLVAEDTIVDLGNVVVTTPVADSGFWISEPDAPIQPEHSGIYVYVPDPLVAADLDVLLSVGTAVDLTGRYSEYYDNSEITVEAAADVQIVGNFNIPPFNVSACDVGTGGPQQEPYEGVLVRVTNLLVTDENPDDPNDYGEFEVDGCLRVDNIFYPYEPTGGQTLSAIVGPLNYAFSNAKIEPRGPGDILP